MKLNSQKGKKIGIFGLGLTGCSAFSALDKVAQTILCWDDLEANRNNFKSQFGSESLKDITEKDFYRVGDLAFSFENRVLAPKTSTVLYVVTRA